MKFVPPATASFEQRPAIVVSNCVQEIEKYDFKGCLSS